MADISELQNPEILNIFIKQILAKYKASQMQILFEEHRNPADDQPDGTKEPLILYINNAGLNHEFPVQCITEIILSLVSAPTNTIICNSKSRVTLTFKVFLLVKNQGVAIPELIILPDDIGTKCKTKYDMHDAQYKNHDYPKESLRIVDNNFVYTIDIPLSMFDKQLTPEELSNPTLESHVQLNSLSWVIDVDSVGNNGTGDPPLPATTVAITISEDIHDKIGIDQDVYVEGAIDNN